MILASRRSGPARFGLFVIAMVQFLAAATLPFTHRHPVLADDGVPTVAEQGERGAPAGHGDFCAVCQTLRHAHTAPPMVHVTVRPAETDSPRDDNTVTAASTTHLVESLPRAPPTV